MYDEPLSGNPAADADAQESARYLKAQADPIVSSAASLMALGALPQAVDPRTLVPMEQALRDHAIRIGQDDFGGLEILLTCQTQLLHQVFAQSLAHYAASSSEGKQRLHSAVALKSQNHCRMTVTALAKLKKSRNELRANAGNKTGAF